MTAKLDRRTFLAGTALAAAATLPRPARAQAKPVRIGLLTVKTGPLAQGGIQMERGTIRFLKDRNYTLAGRKVELVVADTGGNPAGTKTKTQELTERDNVDMIFGPLAAFELLAITDYAAAAKMPILSLAAAEDMTQRRPNPYFIRASATSSQGMHALADYAAKELKYKRVITLADDFAFGHEQMAGFQRVFEDAGGRVVQKIWVPLNALDFAPYLTQLPRDIDAVVQVFVAAQAVRFAKQYAEQGLKERLPLIGIGVFTDESALRSMGDEAIGIVTSLIWAPTLQTPANQTFMRLAEAKGKNPPAYFTAVMYSAGRWITAAASALEGQVEDRARFLAAIRRASETTPDPRGPITLDEYGNPTQNVYILKVERVSGKLQNTVIHTYPMVSQFWTYKPEEFLKMPAYDRNYPPLKP